MCKRLLVVGCGIANFSKVAREKPLCLAILALWSCGDVAYNWKTKHSHMAVSLDIQGLSESERVERRVGHGWRVWEAGRAARETATK